MKKPIKLIAVVILGLFVCRIFLHSSVDQRWYMYPSGRDTMKHHLAVIKYFEKKYDKGWFNYSYQPLYMDDSMISEEKCTFNMRHLYKHRSTVYMTKMMVDTNYNILKIHYHKKALEDVMLFKQEFEPAKKFLNDSKMIDSVVKEYERKH